MFPLSVKKVLIEIVNNYELPARITNFLKGSQHKLKSVAFSTIVEAFSGNTFEEFYEYALFMSTDETLDDIVHTADEIILLQRAKNIAEFFLRVKLLYKLVFGINIQREQLINGLADFHSFLSTNLSVVQRAYQQAIFRKSLSSLTFFMADDANAHLNIARDLSLFPFESLAIIFRTHENRLARDNVSLEQMEARLRFLQRGCSVNNVKNEALCGTFNWVVHQ